MSIALHTGDCRVVLATLPDASVHCVVTSPPYWGLRDYGVVGQLGLEPDFRDYVATMAAVFREVRRVLRKDGTLWLNLGDSYASQGGRGEARMVELGTPTPRAKTVAVARGTASGTKISDGIKPKDLVGIPWRVAFALQEDDWYLRQDIIWSKPNPMPESVTDRCTKAHEYLFLLAKSERYFYDAAAIAEAGSGRTPGNRNYKYDSLIGHETKQGILAQADIPQMIRNKRSVWEVATQPFAEAHFATFPPALIEPCIKAGCPVGGTVLDPFGGAGTTGLVADRLQRNAILIELNPAYAEMARKRIDGDAPLFVEISCPQTDPGDSGVLAHPC